MASHNEHKDLGEKKRSLPTIPRRQSDTQPHTEVNRFVTRRRSSAVRPDDLDHLSRISPGILAQLKAVENDNTLTRGLIEDIHDAKLGKKSTIRMKSGKQLQIELVEGSFRRIAGMSDQSDTSGAFVVRTVEVRREPRKSLGFYIREGDGWHREDGIFISRVNLGSLVETNGLLHVGDEILKVNNVDVTKMPLEDVVVIMQYVQKLVLTVKILTSIPLSRTWTLRKHPSRSSFIQRQRESLGSSIAQQPQSNGTKLPRDSSVPHFQLDTETPGHLYEPVMSSPPQGNKDNIGTVATEDLLKTSDDNTEQPSILLKTSDGNTEQPSIPNESRGGNRGESTPEQEFTEFLVEDIQPPSQGSTDQPPSRGSTDQSPSSERYSGMVSATVHHIDNLDANTRGAVSLRISVDSSVRVKAETQTQADPTAAEVKETFRIDLIQSSQFGISLKRGEVLATRTLRWSQMFPSESDQTTRNIFLKVNPIGRLKITLEYQPMTVAIPRMSPIHSTSAHNPATFMEITTSNPTGSGLPLSVERCVQIIEQHGLETPGIYHICASEADKDEALSTSISQTKTKEAVNGVVSKVSVHAFAGVLKDFFRNLPEPFFTSNLCSELIEAAKITDSEMIAGFIECLPEEVTPTLNLLLGHFRRVCEHSAANGMTTDELVKVFGPLLLAPTLSNDEGLDSYATDFDSQGNVIRILMETSST